MRAISASWFFLLLENLQVPLAFVWLSHFYEEARILIAGIGVLRINLDGLLEIGECLCRPVQRQQCHP